MTQIFHIRSLLTNSIITTNTGRKVKIIQSTKCYTMAIGQYNNYLYFNPFTEVTIDTNNNYKLV